MSDGFTYDATLMVENKTLKKKQGGSYVVTWDSDASSSDDDDSDDDKTTKKKALASNCHKWEAFSLRHSIMLHG